MLSQQTATTMKLVIALNKLASEAEANWHSEFDGCGMQLPESILEARRLVNTTIQAGITGSDKIPARLFIGVYPTGIVYADRLVEEHGDFKRLAFLEFAHLILSRDIETPKDLADFICKHAASIQQRIGQPFQVSASGQTIILGYERKDKLPCRPITSSYG